MTIRHAEKPDDAGVIAGVDETGKADRDSLTPRGWSRAGALAASLAPASPMRNEILARPNAVYASAHLGHRTDTAGQVHRFSRRPLQTISPLVKKLGVKAITSFCRGGEAENDR